VTVSGEVEPARLPSLRDPAHIEERPREIRHCHGYLVRQRHRPPRLRPVNGSSMHCRDDTGQPHGDEQHCAVTAAGARGDVWGEEVEDGEDAHNGDGGKVGKLPAGVALEDVVDGWKEGGDNHDGDADVVEAGEEEVEAVGVAAEEVADAAGEEAEHGAA